MSVLASSPVVYPTGSSVYGFSPPPLHHVPVDTTGPQRPAGDVTAGDATVNGLPSATPGGGQVERRERVLLRPWLEQLINSGSVPGLEWIDEPKTMFKVPWKHRSKKNWSLLHSCVFLEWAKNTGRWMEGDPEPNYAQLKTRLRCAFNKAPDIEEMKSLHLMKCDEPYKVYRFAARRDSRLRPFARTFVTRASVPLTSRRRRRRCSQLVPGGTAADSKAIGVPRQPNCSKYEVESSKAHLGRLNQLHNEDDSYCPNSEYSSMCGLQRPEKGTRSCVDGDIPDHSPPVNSHTVPLSVQTIQEDIKPDISRLQPRRRILPEPEGGFDYFEPVQFRSVRTHSGVPSSMSAAVMARPSGMRTASMVAEETGEDIGNNVVRTMDHCNLIRNENREQECYRLASSSTFVSSADRTSSHESTDNYEEKSGMQYENDSLPSLSPVFSETCDTSPLGNSSGFPPKSSLLPIQLSEDISAPRLHRFKARYRLSQQLMELQQKQHFTEEELHQRSGKNSESPESVELRPSCQSRFSEQNGVSPDMSSKVPVARMLPVTAITNSIAMLDFGKKVLLNDEVDRLTMFQGEHISCKWNDVSKVQSHLRQQHQSSDSVRDERSWISEGWGQSRSGELWSSKQLHQDDFQADGYPRDMVDSSPPKRCSSEWIDSDDRVRSPTEYNKTYFEPQKEMHLSIKNEDNYFHNENGWTEITPVCDNAPKGWNLPPNAVDLTCRTDYGNDDDVIDLSLRAASTSAYMPQNHDVEEYKTMLCKGQDEQSKHRMVGIAVPKVSIESDLSEFEMRLRHRTELIANKTAVLVNREKQLEALEKQLAAREEALAYHTRRRSTSPVPFLPRVLPHTPDHTVAGSMPIHQINRSSVVNRSPSEYADNEYRGLGSRNSKSSPVACDFSDPKRARVEENTFNGVAMSRSSSHHHAQINHNAPLLTQHRRCSVIESDNNAPTSSSAEQDWNHSRWVPSGPPVMSPVQLDSFYMARKRGRPKVSVGNDRFYCQKAMMGTSSMQNSQHRLPVMKNRPEWKFSEDLPDKHVSASMTCSRQAYYHDQVSTPTDSTVLRSPMFAGGQVFTHELNKTQPYRDGVISASMPATVNLLMKSSAPLTSSYSLSYVTSPGRNGEQIHCQSRYYSDSSIEPQKEMPS